MTVLFFFQTKKKRLALQLTKAFPRELSNDVKAVCNALRITEEERGNTFYRDNITEWELLSGERITLPYRIYVSDSLSVPSKMTERQRLIYHCICSRNHNGYVRQKHIEALLDSDPPEWAMPYVIKLCDEFVKEILETVYQRLSKRNCEKYKLLCEINFDYFKLGHSRMISYWSELYRYECYKYEDYIGKKLYRECFGYNRTGQKSIQF